MNFSAFAAIIAVLVADHGAEFKHIGKRQLNPEVQLKRLIEEMSGCVDGIVLDTQHLVDKLTSLHMRNPALRFTHGDTVKINPEDRNLPLPLAKLPEELKTFFLNIENQIKPLTDSFNMHVKRVSQLFDSFYKQLIMQINAFFSLP